MKSLLDVQKEVKELEGVVREAANTLDEINQEIQNIRNSDSDVDVDYDMIRALASNFPFRKHPLSRLDDAYACMRYIELLLCLISLDGHGVVEKMSFIQWVLECSDLDMELRDAYIDSMKLKKSIYTEINQIITKKYKMHLVLDLLLTANFVGTANAASTDYIANLCNILDVDAEIVRQCAILAKIILCKDFKCVDRNNLGEVIPLFGSFRHYIDKEMSESAVHAIRMVNVEVPDSVVYGSNFKWKVKQQEYVKQGTILAEYYGEKDKSQKSYSMELLRILRDVEPGEKIKKIEIKAGCSGVIYQFRDDCTYYGVISVESDNKDSIKAWVRQRRSEG